MLESIGYDPGEIEHAVVLACDPPGGDVEVERMRPVVEAAEAYVAAEGEQECDSAGCTWWQRLQAAVAAYRRAA